MDELDRIRGLLDDAPEPDPARKAAARRQLLTMARAEKEEARAGEAADAGDAGGGAGVVATLRRLLTGGSPWPRVAVAAALVLAAAVGAVLVGPFDLAPEREPLVEPEPDAPPVAEEEVPEDAPVALGRTCEDPDGRYTVDYPDDWHANEPCGAFADEPVEGWDDAIGGPFGLGEIDILVEQVAFEDAIDPGVDVEELEAERTTVDGRDAYRAHLESTGDGALPEGLETYVYYVDLGDHTLIARTVDAGDGTFEQRREVLDRMMETISLHDVG